MEIIVSENIVSDIVSTTRETMDSFWPIFSTIIIIYLGFWVITNLIDVIKKTF